MAETLTYEEYLERHGTLTYTNVGTSMLPLLRQGRDLFVARPINGMRCRVGDVALYRRPPSRYVLHRVVEVLDDGYLMLGDNCVAREYVPEEAVIAVMSGFVRDGRAHDVDEPGYRAYVWLWLRTERLRVGVRRAVGALRGRVRGHHG